jgi:nitrogen fixation/metabolism regulation signal transduction histidine kinase
LKPSKEINLLIKAYNQMVDELEKCCKILPKAKEKKFGAKWLNVAHELKNPLTPMRLTVQSFQRRFNPEDLK